jgi:phosphoglycerate kinase
LSNDLFKAKGLPIGDSIHSDQDFGFSEMLANPKLILPIDVVVENAVSKKNTREVGQVLAGEKIWDSGTKTVSGLLPLIKQAKFILWNGPLGRFENGYTEATFALARALAESNAETIVGGGDTLASIEELKLSDKFTFISTAGGAMLDFLADGTLPGIEALSILIAS